MLLADSGGYIVETTASKDFLSTLTLSAVFVAKNLLLNTVRGFQIVFVLPVGSFIHAKVSKAARGVLVECFVAFAFFTIKPVANY